jgi:hypothetical protein
MPSAVDPASPPAPVRPAGPPAGAPIAYGLAVGGLTTAAFLGAGAARGAGSVAVPIASIAAALLFATTPLLRRLARWAGSPRPARCAAGSLLGAAPLLFLGAKVALGNDPVVTSHWRCGTGDIGLIILSPIAFLLIGTLAGLLAFAVTARGDDAGSPARAGVLGRGALSLGAILVAAAVARAVGHPGTDHARLYLDALPQIAVIPPIDPATAKEVAFATRESTPGPRLMDETRFGDITAQRTCSEGSCSFRLRRGEGPFPPDRMTETMPVNGGVVVTRDEKHGFWILGGNSAFRDRDLQSTDINIQDIAGELSAPTGWILGAAGGVVVAMVLWQKRRRLAGRARRIAAAREGTLGENGWITLHDDTPAWRASPDLALAAGPVLLLGSGAKAGGAAGAYRSEGASGGEEIVAGARETIVAGLRSQMKDLDALGFAAVLITAAPLVASWTTGLLF